MKIRVISKLHELNTIQVDWNDLFISEECNFFQSFEFNFYSWEMELSKNKLNKLCVILIYNNERVSTILPLYIDSEKRLRFINDIHADFCDVLSDNKFDFENILSEISNQFKFNSVHFINLPENSFLYDLYKKKVWEYSILKPFESVPFLQIDKGNFPENYPAFKSKQRSNLRRIQKKNSERNHEVLFADESKFPKEEILDLKEKMIDLGFRDKNYLPSSQINLIENLYYSNMLIISVVKSKRKINALALVLHKSDEFLFWIDMFDDSKMVNIFNYFCLMRKLSYEKNVVMHLGRGLYHYKTFNFKPDIKQLFSVYVFKNHFQLILFMFIERIKAILKFIYNKIK